MAKKARTPDPPRKVQAPKRRQMQRKGLDPERRRTLLLYGGAAAGIVALVVVLVIVLGGKGGSGEKGNPQAIAPTLRAAGCEFKNVAGTTSGLHLQSEGQTVTYDTYPPTTGQHDSSSVIWGNYSQPVDPRQAVHNMEHGGIVIWYGPDLPEAERSELTAFYNSSPNAMIVTPIVPDAKFVKFPQHDDLTTQIALTAWTSTVEGGKITESRGVVAICPRFDEKAFAAFRDELRGKGPERFPVNSMLPGT